jgi:hypothetical protein
VSEQQLAAPYPSLNEAFPNGRQHQLAALGHTENRRTEVVKTLGLPALAVEDQLVRALLELGIENAQHAKSARQEIENSLGFFSFRGFPTGQAPTPRELKKAVSRIAASMRNMESDLNLLMMARRDIGIGEQKRAEALKQMQHAILGSIAARILPASLTGKFTDDEIADAMPNVSNSINTQGFSNGWNGGFSHVAQIADKLADAFDQSELSKPTKTYDIHFTRFIGHLAGIFKKWTGNEARSPDSNATQPSNWRSQFSRFVEAVWPLTPEG